MNTLVTRLTSGVARAVVAVAGIGLVALMILFCADVVSRYALHAPIDGVYEMTTTLFLPMVVFVGMALSVRADTHVRMTVLTERFAEPVQRLLRGLGQLIAAALWGAIALVVGERALQSFVDHEVSTVSFALPVFWGYFIVAAGSAVMSLTSLLNIVLLDRVGLRASVLIGLGIMAAGLGVTVVESLAAVIVGLLAMAAGFFIVHTACSATVPSIAPVPTRASAWYTLLYYSGSSAGALLLGAAWDLHRWSGVAFAALGLTVAAIGVAATLVPITGRRGPVPLEQGESS